jgi:hypothetical protein
MRLDRVGTPLGLFAIGWMLSRCSEGSEVRFVPPTVGESGAAGPGEGLRVCEPPGGYPILGMGLSRQDHIDQFEGCERIDYGLTIAAFEGADLRPLHALREVRGRLILGDDSTYYPHGFPSLEGLEGLRHLEGLTLAGVQVPDLTVFSNLEWLGVPTGGNCCFRPASLEILAADNLVDLHGLENVRGIYSVRVDASPSLRSLEGVHFAQEPDGWSDIAISDSPVQDFGDLSSLTELGWLALSRTPLQNLDAFRSLRRIRFVLLSQNPELVDLGMVAQLEFLYRLELSENPLLELVPDLPLVRDLVSLKLVANPVLVRAPALPAVSQLLELSISGNPRLQRLDSLAALQQLGTGNITANESLSAVDLHSLAEVTGTLRVIGNPQLDPSSFAGLSHVKVGGNRDAPALLSPCPWPDDNECDEPPEAELCAPGTDPVCEQISD